MANVAVVGSQWGDEGKGKIVDWLSWINAGAVGVLINLKSMFLYLNSIILPSTFVTMSLVPPLFPLSPQIGRASCRERV